MADNKFKDPSEKQEIAKKIADQSKRVTSAYETVEEAIFRIFRWLSTLIDHLFFSKNWLPLVALAMACLMYFSVNYKTDSSSLSSSKTLSTVPVTVRYNSETFEISDAPDYCEVVISGDAANVNNAATRNGYCLINLEGYTEGTHIVDITASGYGDSVSAVVTPSQAQITLKKKTTGQFDLSYDFINQNQLDAKCILGTPVFDSENSKINIRASQDTLDTISLVKALIDVSGKNDTFEYEAPLVAYDKNGQMVNAEIVPSTIRVTVPITSPHKTVPINLRLTGESPAGFAVDTIVLDHQSTEIYASEAVLSQINEVYVNLDLSTITADADLMQPVSLPAGVSSSDVTMVNIKTTLAVAVSNEIANVPIAYRNNDNGLGASYVDTATATVTVTGSKANVEAISLSDITVYIDVAGLQAGTYDLPIYVEKNKNAFVTLTVEPSNLHITLVGQE